MGMLNFSSKALNVLAKFYDSDIIVYVEGPSDIPFWEHRFSMVKNAHGFKIKIKSSNAEHIISDKIDKIINQNAKIIVAIDRDYYDFDKESTHPQIIRTYGHSIENTVFCPKVLCKVINKLSRSQDSPNANYIEDILDDFSNNIIPLLVYDIARHIYNKSCPVYGNSSKSILKNKGKSHIVDENQVVKNLNTIRLLFREEERQKALELLGKNRKKTRYLIKGHYLEGIVNNIIMNEVNRILRKRKEHGEDVPSKKYISYDDVFDLAVDVCQYRCKCKDKKKTSDQIKRALISVTV